MRNLSASLLLALGLFASLPALAFEGPYWGPEGLPIRNPTPTIQSYAGLSYPDGAGGAYVVGFQFYDSGDWIQRLTAAGTSAPGWPSAGRLFSGGEFAYGLPSIVPDAWGGVYVIHADLYGDRRIEALHYTASGAPALGWGDSAGVLVVAETAAPEDYALALADGEGGFFVTWTQIDVDRSNYADTIRVRRIRSDGTSYPGWPDVGLDLCHSPNYRAPNGIVSDGRGGVTIVWADLRDAGTADIYAQRISGVGGVVWSAYPNGLPLVVSAPRNQGAYSIAPDGLGGAFLGITDQPDGQTQDAQFYLHQLTRDGTLVPGYGLLGKPIAVGSGWRYRLELTPDGSGGVFACWEDYRAGASGFYVQHFGADGEPVAGWPVGGRDMRPVVDAYDFDGHLCTDMAGGVYCTWLSESDGYRVFTSHLLGNGQLAMGWPEGGLEMTPGRYANSPYIASDSRGGAIVTWTRAGDDGRRQIHAQRYGPATVVATALSLVGWQAQPDRVSLDWLASDDAVRSGRVERRDVADAAWRTLASREFDGERHLRVDDANVIPGARYAYRLAYAVAATERFTAETWIDVPSAHVFALHGARPNPARSSNLAVTFSLRTNASATLELFDVNGRRVAGRSVGGMGTGAHTLRWNEGERMRAGLYWLRLRQGSDSALSRVVVVD